MINIEGKAYAPVYQDGQRESIFLTPDECTKNGLNVREFKHLSKYITISAEMTDKATGKIYCTCESTTATGETRSQRRDIVVLNGRNYISVEKDDVSAWVGKKETKTKPSAGFLAVVASVGNTFRNFIQNIRTTGIQVGPVVILSARYEGSGPSESRENPDA